MSLLCTGTAHQSGHIRLYVRVDSVVFRFGKIGGIHVDRHTVGLHHRQRVRSDTEIPSDQPGPSTRFQQPPGTSHLAGRCKCRIYDRNGIAYSECDSVKLRLPVYGLPIQINCNAAFVRAIHIDCPNLIQGGYCPGFKPKT